MLKDLLPQFKLGNSEGSAETRLFAKDQDRELQCFLKVKEDLSQVLIFQERKITFQTGSNQNIFFFSVNHNDIFKHKLHRSRHFIQYMIC